MTPEYEEALARLRGHDDIRVREKFMAMSSEEFAEFVERVFHGCRQHALSAEERAERVWAAVDHCIVDLVEAGNSTLARKLIVTQMWKDIAAFGFDDLPPSDRAHIVALMQLRVYETLSPDVGKDYIVLERTVPRGDS